MPFELQIKTSFSAAHKLDGYRGACKNLHGHNWDVEVFVLSDELNETGIVVDFSEIRRETDLVLKKIDHKVLNEQDVFSDKNPTAENIACWLYGELNERIDKGKARVNRVRVWETGSYAATYWE